MPSHLQGSSCPRTFQEAVEGHVRDRCSPESKVLLGFIHTWFLFLVTCDKDVSAICVLLFVFCTSSPCIRLVLCTAGQLCLQCHSVPRLQCSLFHPFAFIEAYCIISFLCWMDEADFCYQNYIMDIEWCNWLDAFAPVCLYPIYYPVQF